MSRFNEEERAESVPRVLFCAWSELDITSGTPVILCDLLQHFPAGHAEALVEENRDNQRRREIRVEHPIRKYRFHSWLWPFKIGHRIRSRLARLGTPFLVAQIVRRIRQFRPDCILAVYAQPHWILATWIASRLTGVPLLYYVHDTFLEQTERRKHSAFAAWLDRKALSAATVLVLHPYLADYYRDRYGIESIVLRQIIRHPALPVRTPDFEKDETVIGFSGAIYDNNNRQLAELAGLIDRNPRLRLKIWTDASPEELRRRGICGPRVEVAYEANYESLLSHLAECDVLYLPLAFSDTQTMTTHSLQYAFPTKSLDYLVCGVPVLVHCPAHFELSRFFTNQSCAYVINEAGSEAIQTWLDRWLAGEAGALDDRNRRNALALFSPDENKRILWQLINGEGRSDGRRLTDSGPRTAESDVEVRIQS